MDNQRIEGVRSNFNITTQIRAVSEKRTSGQGNEYIVLTVVDAYGNDIEVVVKDKLLNYILIHNPEPNSWIHIEGYIGSEARQVQDKTYFNTRLITTDLHICLI